MERKVLAIEFENGRFNQRQEKGTWEAWEVKQ